MQARCISHHSQSKDSWRRSLELFGPLGTQTVPGGEGIPGLLQKGEHTTMSCSLLTCTELTCPLSCHEHFDPKRLCVHAHDILLAGFSAAYRL